MARFNQEPRSAGRSVVTRQVWGQAWKSVHNWAWIYGVHKQAQIWLWLRWRISNSQSTAQEGRLRAELKQDSRAHEQGVWVGGPRWCCSVPLRLSRALRALTTGYTAPPQKWRHCNMETWSDWGRNQRGICCTYTDHFTHSETSSGT